MEEYCIGSLEENLLGVLVLTYATQTIPSTGCQKRKDACTFFWRWWNFLVPPHRQWEKDGRRTTGTIPHVLPFSPSHAHSGALKELQNFAFLMPCPLTPKNIPYTCSVLSIPLYSSVHWAAALRVLCCDWMDLPAVTF